MLQFVPLLPTMSFRSGALGWCTLAVTGVLCLAGVGSPRAAAQVAVQAEEQARAAALERDAAARIETLRRDSESLANQANSLLGQVRRLEVERERAASELAALDSELERTARVLTETSQQIDQLQAELDRQRPLIEARLVETYKLGQARYARLLLGIDNLQGLGRAYRMVTELARLDRQRVETYRITLGALDSTRLALEERQAEDRRLRAQARAAQQALEDSLVEQHALMRRIAERRDLNEQFTAELRRSRQLLQATLAAMAGNAPAGPVPPGLPLRPFQGALPWPASGETTRATNEPGPDEGTVIVRDGIEITARQGVAVRAIHQGRVVFADRFTGFGNLVIVDHGAEAFSVYGYLSVLAARRDALVDRGQILGSVGRSVAGNAALYFELRIDGSPVDPLEWLEEIEIP